MVQDRAVVTTAY